MKQFFLNVGHQLAGFGKWLITNPPAPGKLPIVWLSAGGVILVLGILVLFARRLRARSALSSWLVGVGLSKLLLVSLIYENVPVLTWPIWWLLIGIGFLGWLLLILRKLYADIKKKATPANLKAAEAFQRYLPRAKAKPKRKAARAR